MKNKIIAFIPIHIEYETEKEKKELIKYLADICFGRYGGTYSYEKKKCRVKDIKI
jgi:hypothetical protein